MPSTRDECLKREHQAAGRHQVDRSLGSGAGAGGSSSVSSYFLQRECYNGAHQAPCATAEDPEPPVRPLARLPSSNHPTGDEQDLTMISDNFGAEMWRAAAVPRGSRRQPCDPKYQCQATAPSTILVALWRAPSHVMSSTAPATLCLHIQPPLNTSSSLLSQVACCLPPCL